METYEKIKALRIRDNLSQEELARKVGYTDRSSIAKIEAGKVDLTETKLIQFARVFNISIVELMCMDDDPAPSAPIAAAAEAPSVAARQLPQGGSQGEGEAGYSAEERRLVSCWRRATDKERLTIATILSDYGMTLDQDTAAGLSG